MKSKRLMNLFRDAGVTDINAPDVPLATLSTSANDALQLTGLNSEEIQQIQQAFTRKEKTSIAALAIGSGFAAWSIAQSSGMLDHAVEQAQDIGVFIVENLDTLTAGWDVALPVVANFLTEFTLKLPGGSVELGLEVLNLFEHPALLAEAIGMKLEYGTHLFDALELVGLGADAADILDGFSTLGLSLAASWLAGKLTTKYYASEIEEKRNRLSSLLARNLELMKLRKLLKTELPSAVIAGQLERVDIRHWGF